MPIMGCSTGETAAIENISQSTGRQAPSATRQRKILQSVISKQLEARQAKLFAPTTSSVVFQAIKSHNAYTSQRSGDLDRAKESHSEDPRANKEYVISLNQSKVKAPGQFPILLVAVEQDRIGQNSVRSNQTNGAKSGRVEVKKITKPLPLATFQPKQTAKQESSRVQSSRKVIPARPLPAYTSAQAQAKGPSSTRYVNKRMETELSTYKMEIEKRF